MAVKPQSYPEDLQKRIEHDWRAYDDYYSDQSLKQPYFYHDVRREGVFVDALMRRFGMQRGASLIDIGCGNGFYCKLFHERGLRVVGVDRSEKAIRYCRETYGDSCEWLCEDAFAVGREGCFDYAFCFWFMYFNGFDNLRDAAADASRLMRLLVPGGKLFFLWHSDLTAIRLPPARFSVMNYTLAQLRELFPDYYVESYAIDSPALACRLLGRYAFNKYVTRLSCARVYMQASSWKRARLMLVVHNRPAES